MSALRPTALRVGPSATGEPVLELQLEDGHKLAISLSVGHASHIADRLRETVDGRVWQRPPSRRVLQITIDPEDPRCADTLPPPPALAMTDDREEFAESYAAEDRLEREREARESFR